VASVERSWESDRDLPGLPRERIERLSWAAQPIASPAFLAIEDGFLPARIHFLRR
jgi:hypothetical protein